MIGQKNDMLKSNFGINICTSWRGQSLVSKYTGKTPYNVRETPKAFDTKFLLETIKMAELIALGKVIIQRIYNGQSAGKKPKFFIMNKYGFPSTTARVSVLMCFIACKGLRYSLTITEK